MKHARLFSTILIFLSIIFLPYWVYVPLIFLAAIVFPLFWEGIILGFLIDALYGRIGLNFSAIFYSYSFWIMILLLLLLPLRRVLRTYA